MSGPAPTQLVRVLRMLREADARGVTTSAFLVAHIPRFGARVLELRERGHVISTERVRAGEARYTLVHDAERAPEVKGASARDGAADELSSDSLDDAPQLFAGFERAARDPYEGER